MGPSHAVFAFASFWWFEQYPGFARYLTNHCKCVHRDKTVIIYDLID